MGLGLGVSVPFPLGMSLYAVMGAVVIGVVSLARQLSIFSIMFCVVCPPEQLFLLAQGDLSEGQSPKAAYELREKHVPTQMTETRPIQTNLLKRR